MIYHSLYIFLQRPLLLPPWFLNFKSPLDLSSSSSSSSSGGLPPSLVSPLLYPALKTPPPLLPPPPLSFLLPSSPPGLLFSGPVHPLHPFSGGQGPARTGPGRRPKAESI